MQIDLNADMGESFGLYHMGNDEAFMRYVTSANLACGFHAGDPSVMRKTVALAKRHGVQVGAHPGLPDLQGFGRREMNVTVDEVRDIVVYQVGALKAFVEAAGMRLHHVKPHGSLYSMMHRREEMARAVCRAVEAIDPAMYVYLMKHGVAGEVAETMGRRVVYELYADLEYDAEGNVVITRHHEEYDPQHVVTRVLRMVRDGRVATTDGTEISLQGDSVCVHSDTPGAPEILVAVRTGLEEAGYTVASPPL